MPKQPIAAVIEAPWVVQRYEPPFDSGYGAREAMRPVGEPQKLYMWRDVVEAVTLAIGPNSLDASEEKVWETPAVFERDGVIVLVYLKLEIN